MGDTHRFGNVEGPVQTGDGVQYSAGRDQYVAGRDQVVHSGPGAELVAELSALREVVAELRLTEAERAAVEAEVTAMETEVQRDDPDRGAVSRHLEAFTRILREAGAFASAGAALIDPIRRLAGWLGPLGAGILARL